jgi:hypothetical protein
MNKKSSCPPPVLGNARVLEYVVLPQDIKYSGHSNMFVGGKKLEWVPCLAICQDLDTSEVLLFYCDVSWDAVGIAGKPSISKAKEIAERSYPGVSAFWVKGDATDLEAREYLRLEDERFLCSFCGRGPGEQQKLIAKNYVRICDNCIEEFYKSIHE